MDDTHAHVAAFINGLDPGAFVTKYVIIAEVIDTHGDRAIWLDSSDDATPWDTYGLLTFALNQEQAAQTQAGEDE